LAISLAIVAVPIAAVALGLIVFPIDFVLKMVGVSGASGAVGAYLRFAPAAFAPQALPTWLPRLVVAGPARADVVRQRHRSLLARDVGAGARRHATQGTDAGRTRAPLHRDA